MAMDLLGARLTALHDVPSVDAALIGARLTVLHDVPSVDAALMGARLTVLHDLVATGGGSGLQSIGVHRAEGSEQHSGFIDLRGWWRYSE